MPVQSIVFEKKFGWTRPEATEWVASHAPFRVRKVDETRASYRFRQQDPYPGERLRTKHIHSKRQNKEIGLVFGFGGSAW